MIRRKYVPLRIVQPGMMIDQAIIDRAGRVLIARRTRLEDFHIDALKKMGVTGIYTCEGTEDVKPADADKPQELPEPLQKKYEQVKVKDPAKVQISESVRSRVAQGVQYLYQDTQSPDFTNASRSITDDLLRAIEDNDAVAVDIGALKISDEYTFKHSVDVATMSMIVARKYGLDDEQVYEIGIAGLLHDIGKSKVPNEILNKAARLTDEEFAIMKQHSVYGYRILQSKEDLSMEIKLGVLQHHEKMNGKGYPMGITGDKIDLFSRLISVSDIYDALVTERPYKKPFSPRDAVEMIMSMTEELDITVMRCFLESVILYPVGTDVALSNGETARIVENVPNAVLRPKVLGFRGRSKYQAFVQKGLVVEIDHQSRIDGFSIYPDFKMYVVGGGPACFAGNRNRCTCFHMIARTDQVFGIMGVYRFQAVVMTHDDYVAITPAPTCHSDDPVESCQNGVPTIDFQVYAGMISSIPSSIRR